MRARPAYPFFINTLQNISHNTANSFNRTFMSKYGLRTTITDSRNAVRALHALPVVLTVQTLFVSNALADVVGMASTFLERCETIEVFVSLKNPDYTFPVLCRGTMDVVFPDARRTEDTPDYGVTFQMALETYTGWTEDVPTVKDVSLQFVPTGDPKQYADRSSQDKFIQIIDVPDPSMVSQVRINLRTGKRS